jgi:hypothetical protein
MKSSIYIILFIVCPFLGKAQIVTEITKIESELTERPWLDHSVHELYGYKITKVFGERDAHQRHSNMGSMTTIGYLKQEQLIEHLDTLEINPSEKDQLMEDALKAKGGAIQLFIARATQSRANFKWFFIVVRGADDKDKIMEINLEYQASQLPEANGWWNYTIIPLPEPLEFPFYIYVNDKQSQHLSDFKFMLSIIE